MDDFKALARNA